MKYEPPTFLRSDPVDGTPVAGQQFEYAFDDIGNRESTKAGGDQGGAGTREALYSPNLLNQYGSRTVPRGLDVLGLAWATNTVTVNGQAAYRRGEYFWKEWSTNDNGVVYAPISVSAGTASEQRHALLPPALEEFAYDADGNLTQDGLWTYSWDVENRLVAMESVAAVADEARQRLDFAYDYLGRRVQKIVSTWDPLAWTWEPQSTNRFVYDGWNLVAVLDGGLAVSRSFVWGSDLSGSQQGAGGVGGLLSTTVHSGANAGTYFYCFDGNGNVAALANAADGSVAARYEYGPFGEVIRATGPMAKANPFRFSTKYQDDETDLLYYGYRYYSASMGRWLSRDPLTERRPGDSYCFVRNSPVTQSDFLGLLGIPTCGYGCVEPPGGDPCSLSYSFDDDDPWWEKPMYPLGTKWAQTMQQVKDDITAKMKRCCCIRSIFVTAHNGIPGTLMLGDGQVTPGIQKQIQEAADEGRRRVLEQSIQREKEFLQFISNKMCKNGKVTFVECSAGSGPDGDALNKWLQQIFGPSVDVTLFSGDVRWSWGTPKCSQK